MNVDQLEDYFQNADLAQFEAGGANHFTAAEVKADPAAVLQKVCTIYHVVRPFMGWAGEFFLLPKKVRDAIKMFTSLMDKICPSS